MQMSQVIKMLPQIIVIYGGCKTRNISRAIPMTDSRFRTLVTEDSRMCTEMRWKTNVLVNRRANKQDHKGSAFLTFEGQGPMNKGKTIVNEIIFWVIQETFLQSHRFGCAPVWVMSVCLWARFESNLVASGSQQLFSHITYTQRVPNALLADLFFHYEANNFLLHC